MATRHDCVTRVEAPASARRFRNKVCPFGSDLEYLEAEVQWVEARARRLATGHVLLDAHRDAMARFIAETVGDRSALSEDLVAKHRYYTREETRLRRSIDARLAATHAAGTSLALDRLQTVHELDGRERLVLVLAAAPCFALRYIGLFAQVAGSSGCNGLTIDSVFSFLELPPSERIRARSMFVSGATLVRNDLVKVEIDCRVVDTHEMLNAQVKIGPRTFRYLVGDDALGAEFRDFSSVEEPRATFDQVVLDPADRARILSVVERHDEFVACRAAWGFDRIIRYGRGAVMLFHGSPGTGKTLTAHAIAHRMGKKVFSVDIPTFVRGGEADRFLPSLFREARMHDAILFLDECEALFADRRHGNHLMTVLLTELEVFEGVAVLATNLPDMLDPALERRVMVRVRFPNPDRAAREGIWQRHVPAEAPLASDVDLAALASRYELTGGLIKNAVLMAAADAFHAGGAGARITMANLERAAEDQMKGAGDGYAKLETPKVTIDDVVLPASLLARVHEIVAAARTQATVLDRWGIGARLSRGRGVSALFHGEPGTGKTLAAEAIAAELGSPLLSVAIPSVVSMWVGETEKNLATLFRRARATRAVLFLDECDSLLATRDSMQATRHGASAVNVLLDELERHDGVTLMATNLPDRLDRALARRVGFHLRFEVPDACLRARIWKVLIGDTAPLAADVDLDALARRFALSGGHIKNAVFRAAVRAAERGTQITQAHLLKAAEDELGAAGLNGKRVGFVGGTSAVRSAPEA